ncbi:MAG: hypothetical protein COA69_13515 [Robiginitomaculum sp.]|nr:MAG: hypothetical protein COA69_13515 [Robiginitomaculum sp.]
MVGRPDNKYLFAPVAMVKHIENEYVSRPSWFVVDTGRPSESVTHVWDLRVDSSAWTGRAARPTRMNWLFWLIGFAPVDVVKAEPVRFVITNKIITPPPLTEADRVRLTYLKSAMPGKILERVAQQLARINTGVQPDCHHCQNSGDCPACGGSGVDDVDYCGWCDVCCGDGACIQCDRECQSEH